VSKNTKILVEMRTNNENLMSSQKKWLDDEKIISDEFKDTVANIFKNDKMDEHRLMEVVDDAAREADEQYSLESPSTESKDFFEFHKIAISFSGLKMESLLLFDNMIETQQKNLRVEEVDLSSSGNGIISAKFVITALGINSEKQNINDLIANLIKDTNMYVLPQIYMNYDFINENE
jgi:hypothetical protein